MKRITRLPLWGRDQNSVTSFLVATTALPDYPCGGEIKTDSLPSHKKAKNECLAWIILISSGSVGLDFLKWFKNFNTCRLVIS